MYNDLSGVFRLASLGELKTGVIPLLQQIVSSYRLLDKTRCF